MHRYHVPKDLSEHIDYITPGVKTMEVRKARPAGLEKRTFGLKNQQPPLLKDIPETIERILESLLTSTICDTVITPDCIRSELTQSRASCVSLGERDKLTLYSYV
jgi:tripeptidyl-peptidase-1